MPAFDVTLEEFVGPSGSLPFPPEDEVCVETGDAHRRRMWIARS